MADTLEIFGTEYTGVTGIIAIDNNTISHSKRNHISMKWRNQRRLNNE